MKENDGDVYSDKNKWFTDDGHTSFLKCTTDHLIDCLLDIFKGDKQQALRTSRLLHQVSFEEYVNYGLYKE